MSSISVGRRWGEPTPAEEAQARALLEEIEVENAAIAAAQARQARRLAQLSDIAVARIERIPSGSSRDAEIPMRSMAAEVAAVLRLSDRSVQRRMSEAATLVASFPATFASWSAGRIHQGHVTVILREGMGLDDPDARAWFDAAAAVRAEAHTPGRLAPVLRALSEQAQSRSMAERHREARARRRITITDTVDGMCEINAVVPSTLGHGILDRLTEQAKALIDARATDAGGSARGERDAGAAFGPAAERVMVRDERSIDEVRADLFADLLLTSVPAVDPVEGDGAGGLGAIRAIVQVTVPALSLAGLSDDPAELVGHGPIDLDTARQLAAGAPGWERVLSDPVTGGVLAVDRYTPGADLKRYLRARDEHCRFPGCRMPARRCEIDHTVDWALDGETVAGNLSHLCSRHHTLKHASPWSVEQRAGGVLVWTSPAGRTYIDEPPAVVRFGPGDDPPPF